MHDDGDRDAGALLAIKVGLEPLRAGGRAAWQAEPPKCCIAYTSDRPGGRNPSPPAGYACLLLHTSHRTLDENTPAPLRPTPLPPRASTCRPRAPGQTGRLLGAHTPAPPCGSADVQLAEASKGEAGASGGELLF